MFRITEGICRMFANNTYIVVKGHSNCEMVIWHDFNVHGLSALAYSLIITNGEFSKLPVPWIRTINSILSC